MHEQVYYCSTKYLHVFLITGHWCVYCYIILILKNIIMSAMKT